MSHIKLVNTNMISDKQELTENQRLSMFLRTESIQDVIKLSNLSNQKKASIIASLESAFAEINNLNNTEFPLSVWTKIKEQEERNQLEIADLQQLDVILRKVSHVMKYFIKGELNENNNH
jgi:hypothetical protein